MGRERNHDGVRAASDTSIEIDFYFQGQRCRERIKLQPTPANLKRASQHRAAMIPAGTLAYPAVSLEIPGMRAVVLVEIRPASVVAVRPAFRARADAVRIQGGELLPYLRREVIAH